MLEGVEAVEELQPCQSLEHSSLRVYALNYTAPHPLQNIFSAVMDSFSIVLASPIPTSAPETIPTNQETGNGGSNTVGSCTIA
jgi:hypothetical protein